MTPTQIILTIGVILAAGAVIAVLVFIMSKWAHGDGAEEASCEAEVASKRIEQTPIRDVAKAAVNYTRTLYFVTFDAGDEVAFEFSVSLAEFESLAEGDRGTLAYRGTSFVSFVKAE